ncbi:MAG: hypothetical protein HY904_09255 [Deltaproteobacteria bacterium]|nr:hypothetical protein [Deltaproteobacteria bacterium]
MAVGTDEFLRRFVAPLLAGGRPACGPYVGASAAGAMGAFPIRGRPGAEATWDGVRARAAGLDARPPANPTVAFTRLCAAAHDLLAGTHPDAPHVLGLHGRGLGQHAEELWKVGPPDELAEALTRHAAVAAALTAVRVDVHVAWWTGSADFHGQSPPARLLAWPGVRRVRQEQRRVPLVRAGLETGSARLRTRRRALLDAMMAVSPLTPLLFAAEDALPFPLDLRQASPDGNTYASLRFVDYAPLRTLLTDHAMEAGFHPPVRAVSQAVGQLLSVAALPPWVVARALVLVAALHERRLFAENVHRAAGGKPRPLTEGLDVDDPVQRQVWALWRAARRVLPGLGRAPVDHTLGELVEEVDRAVAGPQVEQAAEGLVRAAEARLAG